tara:strand:- start:2603 stop:2962 length:360 start_codon:yes stop_codon:yes gene_type:complete
MRSTTLLTNVDASVQQISADLNFDQRAAWKVYITSSGLDGTPQLFIEDNTSPGINTAPTGDWTIVCNPCDTVTDSFPIDDTVITIEKNDFKSNWFRVRIEPNGNTTGTINVTLSYKTFP